MKNSENTQLSLQSRCSEWREAISRESLLPARDVITPLCSVPTPFTVRGPCRPCLSPRFRGVGVAVFVFQEPLFNLITAPKLKSNNVLAIQMPRRSHKVLP